MEPDIYSRRFSSENSSLAATRRPLKVACYLFVDLVVPAPDEEPPDECRNEGVVFGGLPRRARHERAQSFVQQDEAGKVTWVREGRTPDALSVLREAANTTA